MGGVVPHRGGMGEKLISGLTTGKKDKNIIKKHTIPIFIFTIFIVYIL